jgi:cytochrome P450
LGYLGAVAMQRDPLGFFEGCQSRYGDVFSLPFGTALKPTAWVCDPALVEQILQAPADQLEGGSSNAILRPLVGDSSTLLLKGEEHAARRQILAPEFDHTHLGRYRADIEQVAIEHVGSLRAGEEIDLWKWVRAVTMEVMLRVIFDIASGPRRERLAKGLAAIVRLSGGAAMMIPALRVDLGPLSPWGRFLREKGVVDGMLLQEITARRADPLQDAASDIISVMIKARYADGRALTDGDIRDELLTLIIAGNQTTAGGLAWTVASLLLHREELARVRNAIADGEEAYPRAAITEALRLHTPLFGLGRGAVQDYRLGRFTIPRGTAVAVPLLLVYRSPKLYSDPTLYRPSRHLQAGSTAPSWVPFGGWIRSCVGAAFAPEQIGILLRRLLSGVELELASPSPSGMRLQSGALVVPDREVRVRVRSVSQQLPSAMAESPASPGSR